jgi:hypothetical protein
MRHWVRVAAATLMYGFALHGQSGGWSSRPSLTLQNLYGVAFSGPNTWIAVGVGGQGAVVMSSNNRQG